MVILVVLCFNLLHNACNIYLELGDWSTYMLQTFANRRSCLITVTISGDYTRSGAVDSEMKCRGSLKLAHVLAFFRSLLLHFINPFSCFQTLLFMNASAKKWRYIDSKLLCILLKVSVLVNF